MEVSEDSPVPDAPSSSNITADEIDDETANRLRGDAIGNTMYSEVFVLNTLLQFSHLNWSHEVEDNLCFLWDMTEEQDVCQYLFKISYPSLACSAIQNYTEPRFIEIVVGIFANLLCSKGEKNVKQDEIQTVLNLLRSDDPYILIQMMRFVHAVSFLFDKLDFFEEEHLDRIDYILVNSTNKELLIKALKSLAAITDDRKIKGSILKGEMLGSAITAYQVLKGDVEAELDVFESKEQLLNARHLIQFVCNICSYVDVLEVKQIVEKLKDNLSEFNSEMVLLLNYYSSEDTLLPVDEDFTFYMEALTYIYKILSVGYESKVAKILYEIFLILFRKDRNNLKTVVELFCYFIAVGNFESFQEEFGGSSSEEIKEVLFYVEASNFSYEFDYRSNLQRILSVL